MIKKKILPILLGLMLVFAMTPMAASAEDGGTGHAGQDGWTEWESTTALPNEAGKYYLTTDVTIDSTWSVPSGETTLCLNGKTIRLKLAEGKYGSVIRIDSGRKLTVCDHSSGGNGCITGGNYTHGGGVYNYGGTFTMKGGSISGNTAPFGGGVNNYNFGIDGYYGGTFTMEGGNVSSNTATYGGGVYNYYGGATFRATFTMEGGSISGNTASSYGGGVFNGDTFNIGSGENGESKDITISRNKADGKTCNVFLSLTGLKIHVTGKVSGASKIGITRIDSPTAEPPLVFTTDLNGKGSISNFFGDEGYAVTETGGDNPEAQLTAHKHQWTIEKAASGDTCEIKCGAAGCPLGVYTVTAKAEDRDYTGKPYDGAAIAVDTVLPPELFVTPLTYEGRGDTTYGPSEKAPTNAGTYTVAAIKVEADPDNNKILSLPFSINKVPLTITAQNQTFVYNGKEQGEGDTVYNDPAQIAEKVKVKGLKGSDALTAITIDGQGKEVGKYDLVPSNAAIGAEGKATGNYNITYVNGTLTITKAKPKPTPDPKPQPKINKAAAKTALDAGVIAKSSGSKVTASWGAVKGASSYVIYANYCDQKKLKKIKTVSGKTTSFDITNLNGKKFNPKKNLKFYVVAYKTVKGKKVKLAKSIMAHAPGSKNTKRTNVTGVKVKKASFTLKKGKTAKIKAKLILQKKSKKPLKHEAKFRYATSNAKVAKVSKKGKITAVGKGKCIIYVYAVSGVSKKIKVTVK